MTTKAYMCEKVVAGAVFDSPQHSSGERLLAVDEESATMNSMSAEGKRSRPAQRPVRLLQQVVRGDDTAWKRFVTDYCGFLYSLAWRYARGDPDSASNLVLVALDGLRKPGADGREFYRLRKYLDSLEKFGGRSRFVTWLALVVRNLFRDWFREQEGRRLLPKGIQELPVVTQEIFKRIFWDGLSEREAYETMKSAKPAITPEAFERHVDEIHERLSDRNLDTIYQELIRRQAPLRLNRRGAGDEVRPLEIADLNPRSRPDQMLQLAQDRAISERVGAKLLEAVQSLNLTTRNVLLLHAVHGMAGDEISRAMGFRKRQRVYDELAKARRKIRSSLEKEGIDWKQAQRAVGWLDDIL